VYKGPHTYLGPPQNFPPSGGLKTWFTPGGAQLFDHTFGREPLPKKPKTPEIPFKISGEGEDSPPQKIGGRRILRAPHIWEGGAPPKGVRLPKKAYRPVSL